MARKSRYSKHIHETIVSAQNILRVGMYLRLSVESEDDFEANSLGHQKEQCMSYLSEHPEMLLCGTYIDNGYTGTNFNRDEFQRMIEDVRQKKLNCIIVKDLSRFGRNYIEVDKYLNILFPEWKIRFIAVCDNIDTKKPQDEGIILPLKNIFNDYYSRDISQKIKSSIHVKIENQQFIPGSFVIPYGYLRDGANKTFQVDREAAPVIRRIFEMRAEGQSFSMIARTLNTEEITSPGRLRYLRGQVSSENYANSCWSRDYIRKLTNNPVYIGQRVHGKWVKDSFLSNFRAARPDEVSIVPHAHEAIISDELYARVQRVNEAAGKPICRQRQKQPDNPYTVLLKAKGYCGDCGGKLTFSNPKKAGSTVECSLYFRSGHTRCSCHYMRTDGINEILHGELNRQMALVDAFRKKHDTDAQRADTALEQEKMQIEHQKSTMESKRLQLLEDFADGLIERDEYDAIRERFDQEYELLINRSSSIEQGLAVLSQKAAQRKHWMQTMCQLNAAENADYGLLDALVEKVLVYAEGKQRSVELRFKCRDVFEDCMEAENGKKTKFSIPPAV